MNHFPESAQALKRPPKPPKKKKLTFRYCNPFEAYLWVEYLKKQQKREYILMLDTKTIERKEPDASATNRTGGDTTAANS